MSNGIGRTLSAADVGSAISDVFKGFYGKLTQPAAIKNFDLCGSP